MTSSLFAREGGAWVPLGSAPPPPTTGTIFGSNVGNVSGAPNSAPATRISQFGRIPMSRIYYSGQLPTTLQTKVTDNSPEKRSQVSFKGWQPVDIVAGNADTAITAFAADVPIDTTIALTYWHEPNGELNTGTFTATDYKAAHVHIATLLWSLSSRNRVFPMPCYSSPNGWGGINWNDSWLVPFADLANPNAVISWDTYGNPHGAGGLTGLDTPYPTNSSVYDLMYAKTVLGGYDTDLHWGISETNSPRRNFDASEAQRGPWITNAVNYVLNKPTVPYHIFLWEGDGAQFDQNFYTSLTRDAWKTITTASI